MNPVSDRLVEKELRRELIEPGRSRISPHLEVDVNGSTHIPARVDSREIDNAVFIGDPISAEEFLIAGVVLRNVRVKASGIAVPDLHACARQDTAACAVRLTYRYPDR